MEIKRNILLSLVFHVTIITVAFLLVYRATSFHTPVNIMTVSLFREIPGITSTPSHDIEDNKKLSSSIPQETEAIREVLNRPEDENKTKSDNRVSARIEKEEIFSTTPQNHNNSASVDSIIIKNEFDDDAKAVIGVILELPVYDHKRATDHQKKGPGEIISVQNTGSSNTKDPQTDNASYLYARIRTAIEKATTYPFLARKKRIEGTVMTEFIINKKGYPENINIEKSSGSEILDAEAVKIVMKAAPFPKVENKIIIPISFKLTEITTSR